MLDVHYANKRRSMCHHITSHHITLEWDCTATDIFILYSTCILGAANLHFVDQKLFLTWISLWKYVTGTFDSGLRYTPKLVKTLAFSFLWNIIRTCILGATSCLLIKCKNEKSPCIEYFIVSYTSGNICTGSVKLPGIYFFENSIHGYTRDIYFYTCILGASDCTLFS